MEHRLRRGVALETPFLQCRPPPLTGLIDGAIDRSGERSPDGVTLPLPDQLPSAALPLM
jgi:hypothetical protein